MEETKEKELLILTDEIVDHFDDVTKENVTYLTENLGAKELQVFNPLVLAIMDLQKLKNVKYDPKKETETVQQYKDAKKDIGAFNSSLSKAKKTIKDPLLKLTRGIDAINNSFAGESKEIRKELDGNFKAYLDKQAKIKAEKEAKAEAERNKKINELAEQNKQQQLLIDRGNTYNKIKYDIVSNAKNRAVSNMNQLSLDAVKKQLANFRSFDYDHEIVKHFEVGEDKYETLTPEQDKELRDFFATSYAQLVESYSTRLEELEKVEKERMESQREIGRGSFERVSVPPPPEPLNVVSDVPPSPPQEEEKPLFNDFERVQYLLNEIKKLKFKAEILNTVVRDAHLKSTANDMAVLLEKLIDYVEPKLNRK